MDCSEVRKYLDQYIDKELEDDMFADIRKHISSCAGCKSELAGLRKYRKTLSSLEFVKAPSDFLESVNTRIIKKSFLSRITETLFFPLKIKLPLEAAGLLAAVVVFVILLNPADQFKSLPDAEKQFAMLEEDDAREAKITDSAKPMPPAVKPSVPSLVKGTEEIYAKADISKKRKEQIVITTYEILLAVNENDYYPDSSLKSMPAPASEQISESAVVNKSAESTMDIASDEFGAVKRERSAPLTKTIAAGAEREMPETDDRKDKEAFAGPSEIQKPADRIKDIAAEFNAGVLEEGSLKDDAAFIIIEIFSKDRMAFLERLKDIGIFKSADNEINQLIKTEKVRFRIEIIRVNLP